MVPSLVETLYTVFKKNGTDVFVRLFAPCPADTGAGSLPSPGP